MNRGSGRLLLGCLCWLLGCLLVSCFPETPSHLRLDTPVPEPPNGPLDLETDEGHFRAFVHEKGFPPFDFPLAPGEPLPRGIYPEILNEICRRTGLRWTAVSLPPGRIYQAFSTGEVDVEIGVNPQWREADEAISLYTQPFAVDENWLLVRAEGSSAPLQTIGTIYGYVYPSLKNHFLSGEWSRMDVGNEYDLFGVLLSGRADAVVVTKAVGQYYLRQYGYRVVVAASFDQLPLAIRVRTSRKELQPQFDRALAAMKADGSLAAIYLRYL